MKKLTLLAAFIGIGVVVRATTINAPSSLIGNDALNIGNAYSWGISIAVPNGQTITSASIDFTSVTLELGNSAGTGTLYTDLLNSQAPGVTTVHTGEQSGDYWATRFSGNNITALGAEGFPSSGTTLSWSYTLDASQLAALNSYLLAGSFNIGIDPDCHYSVGGLCFNYTCTPTQNTVPDTATTVALLVIALGTVELYRRLLVAAPVKA
ncbi:MAG TPA: hypothetical protein VL970_01560 [Candidatus Acidoferrales bacterium]|nr:hypothetical protein [Candidatus Acidoferrales bacterium]